MHSEFHSRKVRKTTVFVMKTVVFWLPLLDLLFCGKASVLLLRCPTVASSDKADSHLVDRCHSLRSLLPPPAALPSLPTSFATLSRYNEDLAIHRALTQVHKGKQEKKNRYHKGICSFWLPLLDLNQRPAD